jgi:hypothetical protein
MSNRRCTVSSTARFPGILDDLRKKAPFQRLGAGSPGSGNDYEKLKQHPFFKGINFKKLQNTSPPIPYERFQAAM